jgi:cytochrome c5
MRAPACSLITVCFLTTYSHAGADNGAYIELQGDQLLQGRAVWLANCEGCHGYGIAGAPIPMQATDWAPRLDKGMNVLYEHAINGFFGPDDTMMPERGGNPNLTDQEVKAAVDYMAALANYYIQLKRK